MNLLEKSKTLDWMGITWLVLKVGAVLLCVFILFKLGKGAGDAISRLFGGGGSGGDKKDEESKKEVVINIKGGEGAVGSGSPIRTGYTDDIERYARDLYNILHKEYYFWEDTTPRCEQLKIVQTRLNDSELKILAEAYDQAYNERLGDMIEKTDCGCRSAVFGTLVLDKDYKKLVLDRLKSLAV